MPENPQVDPQPTHEFVFRDLLRRVVPTLDVEIGADAFDQGLGGVFGKDDEVVDGMGPLVLITTEGNE